MNISQGDRFPTDSFGEVRVLKYTDSKQILIEFVNSGTQLEIQKNQLLSGKLKDKNQPTIHGVGCVGYGHYNSVKDRKVYAIWTGIIRRCYTNYSEYSDAYKDCSMCEEWQSFQVFAQWYYENYPKDGEKYQLDKDIKVNGNRIYSPETCMFVTHKENTAASRAKTHKFVNPKGEEQLIYNLREFCSMNNLTYAMMISVKSGKVKAHKGWTMPGGED